MRHDFLDRYSRLESPVHRLSASVKLAAAILLVLTLVLVPISQTWFFAAAAVFLALALILSRVPAMFTLKRLLLLEPFVAGMSILMLLRPDGLTAFLSVFVRSTLCLLTMILLSNTTPFAGILQVFRRIGFPALLVTLLALMYRYLFVLIDEGERMQRARVSRTFTHRRRQIWRMLATVASQLFIRSSEGAERIYAAMCARGWR
jgi:cobalt/nickel transport system permease protein